MMADGAGTPVIGAMIRLGLTLLIAGSAWLPGSPARAELSPQPALIFLPPLAKDIAALPRLAGSDRASLRINDQLTTLDQDAKSFAVDCNTDPPNSFVERDISIEFSGPRFVSFLISEGFYCPGAAHPNFGASPLNFDLATGEEVDWQQLFPADLLPSNDQPGPPHNVQFSARLTQLFLSMDHSLPPECVDEIKGNQNYFEVWLSSSEKGLVVQPVGLAHAMQACGDAVLIPLDRLRVLGFADDLVKALADADQ